MVRTLATCALAAAILAAQTADAPVSVGPAVNLNSAGDAATLVWTSATAANIKYGTYGRLDKTTAATSVNQLRFTGLKPGSIFRYDIPGLGEGSFAVPPPSDAAQGQQRYSFVVLGDSRGNNEMYRLIAAAIAEAKPLFVVHAGNLVANGDDEAQWAGFFQASRPFLKIAAFYPAIGTYDKNSPNWNRFFDRASRYYSFNWGRAHWVILDSVLAEKGPAADAYWQAQISWLEQDLTSNVLADYFFIVVHTPPFSAVESHKVDSAGVNLRLVPVFNRYKVSAVFSAHDHNYQRHINAGIPYIVAAGADGTGSRANSPILGLTQKTDEGDSFVFGKVEADKATFEARAASGRVLDHFQIAARKP